MFTKYKLITVMMVLVVLIISLFMIFNQTTPAVHTITLTQQSGSALNDEMITFAKQVSAAHGDPSPQSVSWVVVSDQLAQRMLDTSSTSSALDYLIAVHGDFTFTGRHPSNVDMSKERFQTLLYVFSDDGNMTPKGFGEVYSSIDLSSLGTARTVAIG